jgi:hypothetical protein
MTDSEGGRSLQPRSLHAEIRERLGMLQVVRPTHSPIVGVVATRGVPRHGSASTFHRLPRRLSSFTNMGGPHWSGRSNSSPPVVITSTPNPVPTHGHYFMAACNVNARSACTDVDDLYIDLGNPSLGSQGEGPGDRGNFGEEADQRFGARPASPSNVHVHQVPTPFQVRRYNSRRSAAWSDTTVDAAMQAVDYGESIRGATRSFGIPPTSLRDHIYGCSFVRREVGRVCYVRMRRHS